MLHVARRSRNDHHWPDDAIYLPVIVISLSYTIDCDLPITDNLRHRLDRVRQQSRFGGVKDQVQLHVIGYATADARRITSRSQRSRGCSFRAVGGGCVGRRAAGHRSPVELRQQRHMETQLLEAAAWADGGGRSGGRLVGRRANAARADVLAVD